MAATISGIKLFNRSSLTVRYLTSITNNQLIQSPSSKFLLSTSSFNPQSKEPKENRLEEEKPFKTFKESSDALQHFIEPKRENYTLPHPIWTKQETLGIEITHREPKGFVDWAAYSTVSLMRFSFDLLSGYKKSSYLDTMDEKSVLTRLIRGNYIGTATLSPV